MPSGGHRRPESISNPKDLFDWIDGIREDVDAIDPILAEHLGLIEDLQDDVDQVHPGTAGTAGQYVQIDGDDNPGWKDHPYIDLSLHLDPESVDHRVALQTLVDANGPGNYLIPAGFEVTLPLELTADAFQFRDGVRIVGEGPTSIINVTGFDANPGDTHTCMGISCRIRA